jgi:hypothetical protein
MFNLYFLSDCNNFWIFRFLPELLCPENMSSVTLELLHEVERAQHNNMHDHIVLAEHQQQPLWVGMV